jgi:DNA primase
VIGLGARTLKLPFIKTYKYLNSPESEIYPNPTCLYGSTRPASPSERVVATMEGYPDVLGLHQGGRCSVVNVTMGSWHENAQRHRTTLL